MFKIRVYLDNDCKWRINEIYMILLEIMFYGYNVVLWFLIDFMLFLNMMLK